MEIFSIIFGFLRSAQSLFNGFTGYSDRQLKKLEEKEITNLTPITIIKKIETAPKIDKIKIEKSYRNIKINWFIQLVKIQEKRSQLGKKYAIMKTFDIDHRRDIYFKVEFDDFPQLGIANIGKGFGIIAVITKVENLYIYLKPIKIIQDKFFVV